MNAIARGRYSLIRTLLLLRMIMLVVCSNLLQLPSQPNLADTLRTPSFAFFESFEENAVVHGEERHVQLPVPMQPASVQQ